MLVQHISGILIVICKFQTQNFVNLVSVEYSKPPLVDEHAFPLTGFAVAWLGCTLH